MNNGKLAELLAMTDYVELGYEIFTPLSAGSCDFIVLKGAELLRIEVKSTTTKSGCIELRRRFYKDSKKYVAKSEVTYLINLNTKATKEVPSIELECRSCITLR